MSQQPRLEYAAVFDAPAAVFADPDAVEIVRMPALCVTTGELVGLDPFNIGCYDLDYAPYERTIRPGLYAGRACIDRATRHVAATWLQVRRATVVRWELATPSEEALEKIQLHEPGAAFAYECRGVGGLADAHALAPYVRNPTRLQHALASLRGDEPRLAALPLGGQANLWVVDAHDGAPCRAWWGLDAHGEVVALVSDFFSSFHACCPPGSN